MKEEKLEEAKRLYETANTDQKYVLESLFPEIRESDDERIRKELICFLETEIPQCNARDKYITWLEKQGEVESDNDDIEVEEKGIREAFNKIEDEKQCKQKPQRMISAEAKEAMYNKPAWSEDDETGLTNTIIMLKEGASLHFIKKDITKAVDWLKSLKERYTWKPSDEQIKVCKEVYADILSAKGFGLGTVNSELNRLEEELKKLKG